MRIYLIIAGIFLLSMLFGREAEPVNAQEISPDTSAIRLAITIDDLPWVGPLHAGESTTQAIERIAAVLRVHQVPATGFVICNKAIQNEQPIQAWVNWGLTIGNHSAAHRDLNRTAEEGWLAEVAECHEYLEQYGDAYIPYFRFPMLHQGDNPGSRSRVDSALQERGLHTAHVTVDNSEWILAQAYAFALAHANAPLRYRIRREFMHHIVAAVKHADRVAHRKVGRSVPQILLLHANTLVEDNLDVLLLELRTHNVEFIPLEDALADPVYSRPDEYIGSKGISWLYRMQPLSVDDVQWDDAEAAAIRHRFAAALSGNAENIAFDNVSSQRIAPGAPAEFESVFEEAGKSERMRSLLVMYQGELIAEAYFNGAGPETPVNLKSVTKSLSSALVGIALRHGWIESVDDSIGGYLPPQFKPDSLKASITIRQLLTMSTGLQPVDYGRIQQTDDWVQTLLSQPVDSETQRTFVYDTPVLQLLSGVLQNISGMSVSALAQRELFMPLHGELVYWRTDARGIELGGNDAYVRSRDLIMLGELYRLGGHFEGHEILPKSFVEASVSRQIMPERDMINHNTLPVRGYGYLWWLLEINGEKMYAALGHGGQILLVSPHRAVVVLMTSRWPSTSSTAHYRHLTRILINRLLPLLPAKQ